MFLVLDLLGFQLEIFLLVPAYHFIFQDGLFVAVPWRHDFLELIELRSPGTGEVLDFLTGHFQPTDLDLVGADLRTPRGSDRVSTVFDHGARRWA